MIEKKDIEFTLKDYEDIYRALEIAKKTEVISIDIAGVDDFNDKEMKIEQTYSRLRIKINCNAQILKSKLEK